MAIAEPLQDFKSSSKTSNNLIGSVVESLSFLISYLGAPVFIIVFDTSSRSSLVCKSSLSEITVEIAKCKKTFLERENHKKHCTILKTAF